MNAQKKPVVIVISGPTGSGKSSLSVNLSRSTELPPVEIISADSRQIYRYMDIGTDKISREIRNEIPHHMIDIVDPDQRYSAGEFARQAHAIIEDITGRGKLPVVVGGTGLYIRILTGGLADVSGPDSQRREYYQNLLEESDPATLYQMLESRDQQRASMIAPSDTFRVIRALEILDSGGGNIEEVYKAHDFGDEPYHCLKLILTMEREILYRRINRRVDMMVAQGLLSEVESLIQKYGMEAPALDAIGYRQIIQHFQGEISLEEAIRIIKRNSRRYAKRQLTWFRRESDVQWIKINPEDTGQTTEDVIGKVRSYYESWSSGKKEADRS